MVGSCADASRLLLTALVAGALATPASAGSSVGRCPDIDVRVAASSAQDRVDACTGVRDATDFFAAAGLRHDTALSIEVVTKLPKPIPATAFGAYDHTRRRILVPSYRAFARRGLWFDVPIDRRAYRSLVTHEAAHALTANAPTWTDVSWHGREYVAYVVMFAKMDAAQRDLILTATPGNGFTTPADITPLTLAFDPKGFAIDAYRHYLRPGVGDDYLRRVVAAQSLAGE